MLPGPFQVYANAAIPDQCKLHELLPDQTSSGAAVNHYVTGRPVMKRFLRWSAISLLSIVVALAALLGYARLHDGPLGILSGGPFTSGEPAPSPPSWDFVKDYEVLQFQTLIPARSRTVWLAVHEARLFIVSGYMNTGIGAIWKHWPHYLEDDDRILVRIDNKLYEQRLQRIMSGPEVIPVLAEYDRKYGTGEAISPETVTSGDTWMFEVLPR